MGEKPSFFAPTFLRCKWRNKWNQLKSWRHGISPSWPGRERWEIVFYEVISSGWYRINPCRSVKSETVDTLIGIFTTIWRWFQRLWVYIYPTFWGISSGDKHASCPHSFQSRKHGWRQMNEIVSSLRVLSRSISACPFFLRRIWRLFIVETGHKYSKMDN